MSTGDLLNIHPRELKFPVELRKQSSCSIQLTNKTDKYVAFKVKTNNPRKYAVRPNTGIVSPRAVCNVTGSLAPVTMQAPKEQPSDTHCKDRFLLQSVIAPNLTSDMFIKDGHMAIEEFKLRVVHILTNPPSPVSEGSEEGLSSGSSTLENAALLDAVSRSLEEPKQKSSETWSMISRVMEEKNYAVEQIQKLQEELDTRIKEGSNRRGFSYFHVVLAGFVGFLMGYLLKRIDCLS